MDPELVFRTIGFINFVSSWLIRLVDPKKSHPITTIDLPLPQEVPLTFRVLPEYFIEDVVDYFLFIVRYTPDSLELSGKTELVTFALTFLTSTWYIKNPFAKSKIVEVCMLGLRSLHALTVALRPCRMPAGNTTDDGVFSRPLSTLTRCP